MLYNVLACVMNFNVLVRASASLFLSRRRRRTNVYNMKKGDVNNKSKANFYKSLVLNKICLECS